MANALLDSMDRQAEKMLACMDNPVVLLRFMHLAAAMPEKSARSLLVYAIQEPDGWTLGPPDASPTIWMPEWKRQGRDLAKTPVPYAAGDAAAIRRATGAPQLEMAVRALGLRPARTHYDEGRQFTRQVLADMRSRFCEEYGYMVLPKNLDIQAQGAAYITAAHYGADISGHGFDGLFDEGALKGSGTLAALGRMTGHARSFEQQLERTAQEIARPLAKHQPVHRRQSAVRPSMAGRTTNGYMRD